jgi:D-sedoheptulose 7-phosphate isomerase
MRSPSDVTFSVEERLLARNALFDALFAREAARLAEASSEMSRRFLRGGRLIAFGRGPCATDAQHVSVEFVHPVIVGKRALPALDLSAHYGPWLDVIVRADDMVMGFAPIDGDADVESTLADAGARGAMTFALSGVADGYDLARFTDDAFMHQEGIEILYHTLWETVHVFFEHRELGHDVGASGFLYPFLGQTKQDENALLVQVAESIRMKVADVALLREQVAREQADAIRAAITSMRERIRAGATLIAFGNGGSATDANDFVMDCIAPPPGIAPVAALSLSNEPANITAVANDVGVDVIFLRQLIALGRAEDVAIGISTSGGSRNVIMALDEARKRGMLTVALLGYDGGEIRRRGLADITIVVKSDYIPRIQEVQASIYHVIREGLSTGEFA